jgi:hypothetical protein
MIGFSYGEKLDATGGGALNVRNSRRKTLPYDTSSPHLTSGSQVRVLHGSFN